MTKDERLRWDKPQKNKIHKKTKVKNGDLIDEAYLSWLSKQPCVITGCKASRGLNQFDMHIHHIDGRIPNRNDYEAIPLMGYVHSWNKTAYHNMTKEEFSLEYFGICIDIKSYFHDKAKKLFQEYKSLGGELKGFTTKEMRLKEKYNA